MSVCLFVLSLVCCLTCIYICCVFLFSSRRRHTRCALVTGVQTCALPICLQWSRRPTTLEVAVLSRLELRVGHVVDLHQRGQAAGGEQIGRASCRERVCQYV